MDIGRVGIWTSSTFTPPPGAGGGARDRGARLRGALDPRGDRARGVHARRRCCSPARSGSSSPPASPTSGRATRWRWRRRRRRSPRPTRTASCSASACRHAPLVAACAGTTTTKPLSFMRALPRRDGRRAVHGRAARRAAAARARRAPSEDARARARARRGARIPYFVPPEHTARAREILGPGKLLAPEQAVVPRDRPDDGARHRAPGTWRRTSACRTTCATCSALGFDRRRRRQRRQRPPGRRDRRVGRHSTPSRRACRPTTTPAPTTSASRCCARTRAELPREEWRELAAAFAAVVGRAPRGARHVPRTTTARSRSRPHHTDGGFRNLADSRARRRRASRCRSSLRRVVERRSPGATGAAAGRRERRRVPARERPPQRADRHLDRPRDRARADGRRDVPHRSDLVGAREPGVVRGPEALRAAGLALDALPPIDFVAGLAQSLRPRSTCRRCGAGRARARASSCRSARRAAPRSRASRPVDELDWWDASRRSARVDGRTACRRSTGARAALLDRHRDPVGGMGRRRARRAASTSPATPATSPASPRSASASARSISPRCRSAPTSRPAMMQPVHLNPEEAVAGRRSTSAPRACSACTTAPSTSPTSRSTSRRGASTPPPARVIAADRFWTPPIGETRVW